MHYPKKTIQIAIISFVSIIIAKFGPIVVYAVLTSGSISITSSSSSKESLLFLALFTPGVKRWTQFIMTTNLHAHPFSKVVGLITCVEIEI